MIRNMTVAVILAMAMAGDARAAPLTVNDFNDILFWTGSGSNEAALVLQFPTTIGTGTATVGPTSIAWGYRWDGSATFGNMLFSLAGTIVGGPQPVAGSDPRLAVDVSYYSSFGDYFVNEMAYDQVGLPSEWSQTVRQIGPYDPDTGEYPAQYQLDAAAGAWTGNPLNLSGSGISGTALVDGGWYGFVQADGSGETYAFTQPVSAVPEPSTWLLLAGGATTALIALRPRRRRARAA